MTSRREILKGAGALAGSIALNNVAPGAHDANNRHNAVPNAPQTDNDSSSRRKIAPLNILILGGTSFIGPPLVQRLVAHGHHVSTFTRGRRQAELPQSVQRLIGDRDAKDANGQLAGNYESLKGKTWDVVIDDSANTPTWVRQSSELLKSATSFYLFVSSTGVFYPYRVGNADENTRVVMSMTENGAEAFGVAKSQAEQVVRDVFGSKGLIVRPTYIVGPGDTSDRFTFWPVRLARGGEILAPGKKTDPSQFIDVRDLADFMVKLVEEKQSGTYNVAGPRETLTFAHFLDEARKAVAPDAQFTWVDDYDFLVAQKLDFACPWGLPRGDDYGQLSINNHRAVSAGLKFRTIGETVKDTLAWWQTLPEERRARNRFVLKPEREAEILTAWKARAK